MASKMPRTITRRSSRLGNLDGLSTFFSNRRAFSSGAPDGFAKFATQMMRCNQVCFERIADDLESRKLPQGARILDLGASAGEPSLTIASRDSNYYVVSTDFAPPNVELGVARATAFGLGEKVEFHTTDAQDLSAWGDGSFDAVVGTYFLMFTPDVAKVCREVHRVLKPGAPFITTVWQPPRLVDIFGSGIMKMMMTMRESGRMPMPDPSTGLPPPANPCNLASSAPEGPLGDALAAAGFARVTAEEWAYEIVVAGESPADVASRFIEATPFHGDILAHGGPKLLAEAAELLTAILTEAEHEMTDLEKVSPQWKGVDNPDGLERGMVFKTNTCLYVTAQSAPPRESHP